MAKQIILSNSFVLRISEGHKNINIFEDNIQDEPNMEGGMSVGYTYEFMMPLNKTNTKDSNSHTVWV